MTIRERLRENRGRAQNAGRARWGSLPLAG